MRHLTVDSNGIRMHLVESGRGKPVILCHGFPELWYSWRHQLPVLAAAGYRAIAPDMRGYGQSDRPEPVEAYDVEHLTGDLVGLLDALGERRAVFVGHDWGSALVWNMALAHPERVEAVVGLSVPFMPRPPAPPTEIMRLMFADRFFYILWFQEVGPADRRLAEDPRRTLSSFIWSASAQGHVNADLPAGADFFDWSPDPAGPLPWLPEEDLRVYVDAFTRTGFTGGLNWYRNIDRNWAWQAQFEGRRIEMPSLYVAGERDGVIRWMNPDNMDGLVTGLRGKILLPGVGHWTQQEAPEAVNRALLDFLAGL